MGQFQGNPCWYELGTTGGALKDAGAFYKKVMGWEIADSGMPDFTYHLASSADGMVAGLMENPSDPPNIPPHWTIYFAVDDLDRSVADASAAGAQVFVPPTEVPGTGRFAMLADPQGAAFGLLQPDMSQMSAEDRAQAEANAPFDQSKIGHGHWNELMTTDPEAGLAFYATLLGWQKSTPVPMGETGVYQLFSHNGTDIGAVQSMGNAPVPNWLAYFGTSSVTEAMARITDNGGTLIHGPQEVPGGAFIAIALDPQGAAFAVVGPKEAAT